MAGTLRLTLLAHAPTAALRAGAFPCDEPLDAGGRAAAEATRGLIGSHDLAIASPARRARETAEAMGLRAAVAEALRDADHGRWAGRPFGAVAGEEPDAIAAWLGDAAAAPHGGESLSALLARTAGWLDGLRAPPTARRWSVLAVTHASVIRALVVHALGAPPAAFWRIDVPPLSRTVLQGADGRWTLRALERNGGGQGRPAGPTG